MTFKLKKISKLNMIVASLMCVVLLFCFCSVSYTAKAAESSVDDYFYKYVPFADHMAKTNYLWYSSVNMSKFDRDDNRELMSGLTFDKLENNKYFKAFLEKYYPTYSSFDDSFDLYGLVGSNYGDNSLMCCAILVVEKGAKVVYIKDLSNGQWGGYNETLYTTSSHAFCLLNVRNNFKEDSWAFYDGSGDAGQSGISTKWNYWDGMTFDGQKGPDVTRASFYVGNGANFNSRVAPFAFTNVPTVSSTSDAVAYIKGDESVTTNKNDTWTDKKEYLAESFYWDNMTCKVARVGVDSSNNKSRYAFSFKYDYTCPLMKDPAEMFNCKIIYNVDISYKDGKGRTYTYSDSQEDSFSLNKHKDGYVNDKLYLNGNIGSYDQGVYMAAALDYLTCFVPSNSGGSNLDKYTQLEVTSAKMYVTVFLYHIPDPDTLFSNPNLNESALENTVMSTDVRYFPFDLYTLKEDEEVSSKKPTVTTEDVVDGDGNVTGKKVTDVTATDDAGKTVINITIDNSNKVIDGNANINTGGSGGDSDDEDKNTKSFWKYVTGIVAFFTALLNSDSGLFAVIASYFKFIPSDFWNVIIGAIVVIAVLSIYRLAKKGG